MPVMVISKFDKDPIKNERASLEKPFSLYKSMGVVRFGRNSNSSEILRLSSLVICKFDEDRIKTEGFSIETSFSPL